MYTIYHNPQCSKSRAALDYLKEQGEDFVVLEYLHQVPTKEELRHILSMLGISALDLIRKQESIFQMEFLYKEYTEEEWIDVMLTHPILIERPIVIKNGRAIIARPLEKVFEL